MPRSEEIAKAMAEMDRFNQQPRATVIEERYEKRVASVGGSYGGLAELMSQGRPGNWASDHKAEAEKYSGWHYVAISAIGKAIRSCDVEAYQEPVREYSKAYNAEDDDSAPLPKWHPLMKILKRPSASQSGASFREEVAIQLCLTGSALIWNVPNQMGRTVERYIIPTAIAEPRQPEKGLPKGGWYINPEVARWQVENGWFLYTGLAQAIGKVIDARDVQVIRFIHPTFKDEGQSPVSAGALWTDTSEKIDVSRHAHLRNGSDPSVIIGIDGVEDESTLQRMSAKFNEKYAGPSKHGKAMFVNGQNVKVEPVTRTPAEMAYEGAFAQFRDAIMALHGVTPIAAGIEAPSGDDGLYAPLKQFISGTVQPILDLMAEEDTEQLASQFGEGITVFYTARAIDDAKLTEQQINTDIAAGAIEVDEIRKLRGRKPWGGEKGKAVAGQGPKQEGPGGLPGLNQGVPGLEPQSGSQALDPSKPAQPAKTPEQIAEEAVAKALAAFEDRISGLLKSGDNCGTGAGGFKPGNTCGKRDGSAGESQGGDARKVNAKVLAWAKEKFGDEKVAENFARWFGDSKVVDEDGNPQVVYHGTKNKFEEFDPTKQSSESRLSQQGPGFYFTDNKKEASGYGKAISVFLSVENPLVVEKRGTQKISKEQAVELYSRGNNDYFFNEWVPFFTGEKNDGKSRQEIASSYVESLMSKSGFDGTDKVILQNLKRAYKSYGENNGYGQLLTNLKSVTGFDGVIEKVSEKTSVYTTFSSSQIKSATGNSGTFDPDNPNITKSAPSEGYRPPVSAQSNARKVLRWKREHGDAVQGMTATGWARARQLASGKKVSRETVGRMAAFARHRKNSKVNPKFRAEPWRDAGYVAWLGWGGDSGVNWAAGIVAGEGKSGSDCGANQPGGGGFRAGNTCGKEDGGSGDSGSSKVRQWAEKKFKDKQTAENFAKWFGDSKFVDENGEPIAVYHGTSTGFTEFRNTGARLPSIGYGFYFSPDADVASTYATGETPQVMQVYLQADKVLDWDNLSKSDREAVENRLVGIVPDDRLAGFGSPQQRAFSREQDDEAEAFYRKKKKETAHLYHDRAKARVDFTEDGTVISWMEPGLGSATDSNLRTLAQEYDMQIGESLGYDAVRSGLEVVVFRPNQIKSATGNSGAFSPDSGDITKSSGCGANAQGGGGFQPGNTCAREDGGGDESGEDYRGSHRAPGKDSGAPLHDVTGNGEYYPDDIYGPKAVRLYNTGSGNKEMDVKSIKIIQSLRGKPDAEVTIYRAVPKDTDGKINPGDWVTINRDYAVTHGEGPLRGEYRIMELKVRASDVFTSADSIHEYGYDPAERSKSGSSCGANAEGGGGFQPGNTCARGDGGESGGEGAEKKASRQQKQKENRIRERLYLEAELMRATGWTAEELATKTESLNSAKEIDSWMRDELAKLQTGKFAEARAEVKPYLDKLRAKVVEVYEKDMDKINALNAEFKAEADKHDKLNQKHVDLYLAHLNMRDSMGNSEQELAEYSRLGKEMDAARKEAEAQGAVARKLWEKKNKIPDKTREKVAAILRKESAKMAEEISPAFAEQFKLTEKDIAEFVKRDYSLVVAGNSTEADKNIRQKSLAFMATAANPEFHNLALKSAIHYQDGVRANAKNGILTEKLGKLLDSGVPAKEAIFQSRVPSHSTFAPGDEVRVYVHEMGHQLEFGSREAAEYAGDFLRRRTSGDELVSFADRFGAHYRQDERGSDDEFGKAIQSVFASTYGKTSSDMLANYAGKIYSDGSTEVLSVGLELFHENPKAFAEADPEWFDLVTGVLTGRVLRQTKQEVKAKYQ